MLDTSGEQAIRILLERLDFTSFKLVAVDNKTGNVHIYGDPEVGAAVIDGENIPRRPGIKGSYETLHYLLSSLPGKYAKALARELIREIEPSKRSRYPYSKKESSRPRWWPARVRHTTPEHLLKRERTQLLESILLSTRFSLPNLLGASTRIVRQGADMEHLDTIFEQAEALRPHEFN